MAQTAAYLVDQVIPQVPVRWIGVEPARVALGYQWTAASEKHDRLLRDETGGLHFSKAIVRLV